MPYIRRLPSGKWNAVVRLPSGRRRTKTDPLRAVVKRWADDLEAQIRNGTALDPKAGKKTVEAWHREWWPPQVEDSTLALYERVLRLRVLPYWGSWPLGSITTGDVSAWTAKLAGEGVGARSVQIARNVLSSMLRDAARSNLISVNPCSGAAVPSSGRKPPRWFNEAERARLLAAVDGEDRTFIDLAMHTGLRWGELAGLHGSRVDVERRRLHVVEVLTHVGQVKPYPKTDRSVRDVPIPEHLVGPLAELVGRNPAGLVFVAPDGGPLRYHNWRNRVWVPACITAGVTGSPHAMRHTAASRLVMAGVDLYRVSNLLGHSSIQVTQQYAHLAPDYHDAITAAWDADPRVTHGPGE